MNRSINIFKAVCIALVYTLSFASCKKDDIREPVPTDKLLLLEFNSNTISENLYDSATVILQKKGTQTFYLLRFTSGSEGVQADIEGFRAGEYNLSIYLYARVGDHASRREYEKKEVVVIPAAGNLRITAPNGSINDSWKPRVILSYNNGIDFYVSLDNSDPYFRIRLADKTKWKRIELERFANNKIPGTGTELIAKDSWSCDASCFDNANLHENSVAFASFANEVKTKTWNFGEIEIVAETTDGIRTEDYFTYNK